MNIFSRAWRYVTRNKSKSLIMFLILFGMSTATISGVAIKKSTEIAKNNINASLNASFSVEQNLANTFGIGSRGFAAIKGKDLNLIKGVDTISKSNLMMVGEVELINAEKVDGKNVSIKDDQLFATSKKLNDIEGLTNSSLDNKFSGEIIKLKEGKHIDESSVHEMLVHETFAKENGLKLGDIVEITQTNQNSIPYKSVLQEPIKLTVVGIFTGDSRGARTNPFELVENLLITDINTVKELYDYNEDDAIYQTAQFFVNDPKELESTMSEVKKLPIDWSQYKTTKTSDNFATLSSSLDNMNALINTMIYGTLIVSAIILSLLMAFWINGRMHEIGILLSLGFSKFNIIAQYTIELMLIAALSFSFSYFSGRGIAQNLATSMAQRANQESMNQFNQGLGGMNFGQDPNSSVLTKGMDDLDIDVTVEEMIPVYIIGTMIIIVSVSLSSVLIVRLKPREILTKIS